MADLDRSPEEGPRLADPLPLYGVLDNIRSAWNVGSFFRTSEAARLSGLELCGITPYPPNARLDRTALGTQWSVPWRHHVSTSAAIDGLHARGIHVFAIELAEGARSIREVEFPAPCAIVFGHEVAGVGEAALRAADGVVEVPLYGRKNSLNVATTFGIVVFEILRQWGR